MTVNQRVAKKKLKRKNFIKGTKYERNKKQGRRRN